MTNKLFTLSNVENIEANTLVMNTETLGNAEELVKAGKAMYVDLSEYDTLRNEAKQRHQQYHASRKRLLESDDPIYKDKEKLDYELNKIREAYDSDVVDIRERYEQYKSQAMTKAQATKAQVTHRVSERDKETARQFIDRASIELLTHGDSMQGEIIENITNDINALTESQRQALQSELPSLLRNIDDVVTRRKLVEAAKTSDKSSLAVEIAKQLPNDVTIEYRQMRAITRGGEHN